MSAKDKMLSAERAAHMVGCYQRRLRTNNACAKRYYSSHAAVIKRKKLLAGVAKGRCPNRSTVARLEVDRSALMAAWQSYVDAQNELGERARAFHRYLVGSEWEPDGR